MNTILTTEFGSVIYGTNLPTSDKDYKSIYIPSARDLILQQTKSHIQDNTKKDSKQKNNPDDIDHEKFSLQAYCKLLAEGQTPALDILFCPENFYQPLPDGDYSTEEWRAIKDNKKIFLHKGVNAFIGYTKQQAAKYGIKGFRIAALQQTLEWLNQWSGSLKLQDVSVIDFIKQVNNEHIKETLCKGPNNTLSPHLEVCGRKIPYHATIKYSRDILQKIYDEYGHRAKLAQENKGIDWKAMYHAVRVSHQVEELLLNHTITFPRPEKTLLLKIRKGEMSYNDVANIIENRLNLVDTWISQSSLPDKPDYDKINQLVYEFHLKQIKDNT